MWVYIILCSLAASSCDEGFNELGGLYSTEYKCEMGAIKRIKQLEQYGKFAFFCSYLENQP